MREDSTTPDDEPEAVVLPAIPEPVAIKEAYQRGELTADEAIDLALGGSS
jgi:hypothetical protein